MVPLELPFLLTGKQESGLNSWFASLVADAQLSKYVNWRNGGLGLYGCVSKAVHPLNIPRPSLVRARPCHRRLTALDPQAVDNSKGAEHQAQQAQGDADGAVPGRRLPHVNESCGAMRRR